MALELDEATASVHPPDRGPPTAAEIRNECLGRWVALDGGGGAPGAASANSDEGLINRGDGESGGGSEGTGESGTRWPDRRTEGTEMRLFKSREEKEQIDAGRSEWEEFVRTASQGTPEQIKGALVRLEQSPNVRALSDKERRRRGYEAFERYAENVLADDFLTAEEEEVFDLVAERLGVPQEDWSGRLRPLLLRVMVARANDGRLDALPNPKLMAKKGEVVHLETAAGLMKEVVQREWRSGSGGVSFKIAPGVRYRTGQTRGRSVVVGSQIVIEDSGVLSVSSQRAVFIGSRKTIECAYSKLVNVEVFTDGIQFHVSNRQKPTLLRLDAGVGDLVAATINATIPSD